MSTTPYVGICTNVSNKKTGSIAIIVVLPGMQQMHARIIATLLWLKARYDAFMSRPYGQATFLVSLVLFGTFVIVQPADACGLGDITGCALDMFSWIAGLIASLLAQLITTVIEYLIPVMLYNNFTTAPVVTAGWALVRDTVNMFFVIVLIVIAFGTIFGHKKFQWQTQVPRLLLFAIVINFSKTLAGIMIDFGQVIMLTFANALREIAAGNIIELFGLNKVNSFSATADSFSPTSGNPGASGWDLLLASLAAVFMLAWVLVIMLLLFAILLYRIVGLWVLIVTAPLAWFAGGAEILGSNAYKDWWEQFKCLVAIGPIVTFFLWLALAVAGAGSAAEGFEAGSAGNSASFLTSIFEFQHFMSLVIGSAMIMAGMQTAQKFCSSMSGSFLGKQLGKAAAFGPGLAEAGKGMALKATGRTGRAVGSGFRAVGRGAGRLVTPLAEKTPLLKYGTKRGRANLWNQIGQNAGSGMIGKTLGRFAEGQETKQLSARHDQIAKAGEKYKGDTMAQKANQLNRFAKTGASKVLGGDLQAKALFKEMLGNKDLEKQFVSSGGDIGALSKRFGASMQKDFQGDAGTLDKLSQFNKRHAHKTESASELKDADDLKDLSVAALGDQKVRDHLKQMKVNVKQGKGPSVEMNGMAAMAAGYFGEDKQKIARGHVGEMNTAALTQLDAKTLLNSVSAGKVADVANLALENKNIQQVQQIATGLIEKHDDPKTLPSDREAIARAIEGLYARLNKTVDQKDGSPRFVTQAGALQSMIKRDFPVPLTPKEIQQKEEKVQRVQSDISDKEQKLEGEMDLGKRGKINDDIAALKAQLGPLMATESPKEGSSGGSTPTGDLSGISQQLSSMNSSLSGILDTLSNPATTPAEAFEAEAAATQSLDGLSKQIEKMMQQMGKQKESEGKPGIQTGFDGLAKELKVLTEGMKESQRISSLQTKGSPGDRVIESTFDTSRLQQAFKQLQEKMVVQQQRISKEVSEPPTSS